MIKIIGKIAGIASMLFTASFVSAQSYNYNNGYYDNNYNNSNTYYSGYGNNPNNGVVNFMGGYNNNNDQYSNNYNYNNNYSDTGYNNTSYITPISVSGTSYNCNNGIYSNYTNCSYYNHGYNNNYVAPVYYNNVTLSPTTYAATNVSASYATLNGYVSVTGGNSAYQNHGTTWFQYGASQNNLGWSTSPANVNGATNVNANLTNLSCGTTYYFRLVTSGLNNNGGYNTGLQYGNTLSFFTGQCNYGYGQQYYNNNYGQNFQSWTPPIITTRCVMPYKTRKHWR